jgi:hypothetical protein
MSLSVFFRELEERAGLRLTSGTEMVVPAIICGLLLTGCTGTPAAPSYPNVVYVPALRLVPPASMWGAPLPEDETASQAPRPAISRRTPSKTPMPEPERIAPSPAPAPQPKEVASDCFGWWRLCHF